MILTTGGREFGATSTRSSSASWASLRATSILTTPTCSPPGPTSRTSGTRIRSLVLGSLMRSLLGFSAGWPAADATRRRERRILNSTHAADKHPDYRLAPAECDYPVTW